MLFIRSNLLNGFSELRFGFSTRFYLDNNPPYNFNMSFSVGDDDFTVRGNRTLLAESIGLEADQVAYQKQVHSDIIKYVDSGGTQGESDAIITDRPNIGLAISSADCSAVFIYNPVRRVIAGIHSGWRGTQKKIVAKTLTFLQDDFNCNPADLFVYIAPSISQANYEVGQEVAGLFDEKYLIAKGDKFLLDVTTNNYDMLIEFGIPFAQIQRSNLCSYANANLLHSYRRNGIKSGRALGIIGMIE